MLVDSIDKIIFITCHHATFWLPTLQVLTGNKSPVQLIWMMREGKFRLLPNYDVLCNKMFYNFIIMPNKHCKVNKYVINSFYLLYNNDSWKGDPLQVIKYQM